jgi:hypothetical protein
LIPAHNAVTVPSPVDADELSAAPRARSPTAVSIVFKRTASTSPAHAIHCIPCTGRILNAALNEPRAKLRVTVIPEPESLAHFAVLCRQRVQKRPKTKGIGSFRG